MTRKRVHAIPMPRRRKRQRSDLITFLSLKWEYCRARPLSLWQRNETFSTALNPLLRSNVATTAFLDVSTFHVHRTVTSMLKQCRSTCTWPKVQHVWGAAPIFTTCSGSAQCSMVSLTPLFRYCRSIFMPQQRYSGAYSPLFCKSVSPPFSSSHDYRKERSRTISYSSIRMLSTANQDLDGCPTPCSSQGRNSNQAFSSSQSRDYVQGQALCSVSNDGSARKANQPFGNPSSKASPSNAKRSRKAMSSKVAAKVAATSELLHDCRNTAEQKDILLWSVGKNLDEAVGILKEHLYQHLLEEANTDALSVFANVVFRFYDKNVFQNGLGLRSKLFWNNRLRRSAGITRFLEEKRSKRRFAQIELSTKVVTSKDRLYQTLVHEMCHAAQWVLDKESRPPHGKAFMKWVHLCQDLDPSLNITRCHNYEIDFKFKWRCTKCDFVYGRHSNSIDAKTNRCGKCRGSLVKLLPAESVSGIDGNGVRMSASKTPAATRLIPAKERNDPVAKEN